jgi:oxaloacetate decarboxylase (Na+ extruding) subunit alpha
VSAAPAPGTPSDPEGSPPPAVGYADTTLRDLAAPPWGAAVGLTELSAIADALSATGATILEALDPESAHVALERRGESPWDRLRAIVRHAGRVPVGVGIAGWRLLGSRPVSSDIVRRFVGVAAESGVSRVRVFDPLNDPERMLPAAEAAAEAGITFMPTLMVGPAPAPEDERWLEEARALAALPGARSLCVSDKAGHLTPSVLGDLIIAVAGATRLPIEISVRAPGGLAPLSATAAVVAGAASVQAAAGLVALVACRPSAETLRAALLGWRQALGCDPDALEAASRMVGDVLPGDVLRRAAIAAAGPAVPVPPELGPGVSARLARLGLERSLAEVAAESTRVATDLGAVTFAHPVGDSIVRQALDHLVSGRRWTETGLTLAEVALGRIGRLRGPVAPEALAAAEAVRVPDERVLPDLAVLRAEAPEGLSEEDLILWGQFPEGVAQLVDRRRSLGAEGEAPTGEPAIDRSLIETLVEVVDSAGGEAEVSVEVSGARVTVRRAGPSPERVEELGAVAPTADAGLHRIESPMVGTFYRAPSPEAEPFVREGQHVEAGQVLCLIEAMKLFNEIVADRAGVVREIAVENAEAVEYGQLLVLLERE